MLEVCSPRSRAGLIWCSLALAALAFPLWQRHAARWAVVRRLSIAPPRAPAPLDLPLAAASEGSLLASWQTVGGCGSGATTGAGGGVKWIGPIVTGGMFNVLSQATYMPVSSGAQQEYHLYVNNLISKDVTEKINVGINIPVVYKYLRDPYGLNIDLSNSGLGDIYLQSTLKLGAINNTLLTAALGLPTGKYDQVYKNTPLRQHQQLGFGRYAGTVSLDHVMDELWGLTVLGASAAYRGGENSLSSYRAPAGSAYAYVGYFVGKLVPSVGLSITGLTGHDRDRSQDELTGLYMATPTVSIEWGNDWIGLLAGAAFPYQYDGVRVDSDGHPRSPWGWGPYSFSLALSLAPF
jgi:hypothetical protein